VLITIASAIVLGLALEKSGAAAALAKGLSGLSVHNAWVALAIVYIASALLTELISNPAVPALMFPLAFQMAAAEEWSPRPFAIGITVAASLSFLTPFGYQTNLMVMGPGGYEPRDFLRIGAPLTLLTTITALVLIPLIWRF
jgi:di/tricarboxylate transporter